MERLGAVARLEQERPPGGDLGERARSCARLAGEDERRQRVQRARPPSTAARVGPLGLLQRRRAPARSDGDQVEGGTVIDPSVGAVFGYPAGVIFAPGRLVMAPRARRSLR